MKKLFTVSMKKLFSISMVVFWTGATALLAAGLVVNESGDEEQKGISADTISESINADGTIGDTLAITDTEDIGTEYTTVLRKVEKQQYMNAALVATHNTGNDCWLIIEGKVYDVAEYVPFHPGGKEEIIPSCGTDATVGFATKGSENKPHSSSANAMLGKYLVASIGDPWGTITVTEEVRVPVGDEDNVDAYAVDSAQNATQLTSNTGDVVNAPANTTAPQKSPRFDKGESIKTTTSVSVRKSPGTSGAKLGVESGGSFGTIVGGPESANGYWWYRVAYTGGVTGWSAQDFLSIRSAAEQPNDNADDPTENTTPDTPPPSSGGLTAAEVSGHSSSNDCWLIISDKVYDVTPYIPFHPGGENRIINECGTDATTLFISSAGAGHKHKTSSHNTLANYLVGDLGTGTVNEDPDPTTTTCTSFTYDSWSACQPDDTQTRTVKTSSPSSCVGGGPDIIQSCTYTPPEPPPPSSGGLTAAEVSGHSSSNDCWLIISDKVYDVTPYIPFHPGGENRIINECGTDATTLFISSAGAGHKHKTSSHNTLANYLVGDLGTEPTTPPDPNAPTCTSWTYGTWGTCTSGGTQLRSIVTSSPSGCAGGSPATSQSCTYTPPASPEQAFRDAIEAAYPGANITKLSIEDDGDAEFKFTLNGQKYEGKMNSSYQITEIDED
ncbi:hypothetical protein N8083_00985 [Candidatus Pacebacteria bacterium]|nr:hypothetical protein [Candidatus Paceibacterota bacterium]